MKDEDYKLKRLVVIALVILGLAWSVGLTVSEVMKCKEHERGVALPVVK